MACSSGNKRHWFTRPGSVGDYVEHCVRCGAKKTREKGETDDGQPRPLKSDPRQRSEPMRNVETDPS